MAVNRKVSIRSRLTFLISAIILTFFLLLIVTEVYWFRNRYRQENQNNVEVAQAIGLAFRAFVWDIFRTEFAIGTARETLKPHTFEEFQKYLMEVNEAYYAVRDFLIVDSTGIVIAGSDIPAIGMNISDRKYFQQLKVGDSLVISDYQRTRTERIPGFIVARGFYTESGNLDFAVLASVQADRLGEISLGISRREGRYFTIFDRQGTLVYTNQSVDSLSDEQREWVGDDPVLRDALRGKDATGILVAPIENHKRIGARVPIDDLGWVAGSAVEVSTFFQPFVIPFVLILVVSIIIAALVLILAKRTVNSIAISLSDVQNQVRKVARGDYRPIEVKNRFTELNQLISDVNVMSEQLREREERLRELADSMPQLVWTASPDGKVDYYNQKYKDFGGISPGPDGIWHWGPVLYDDDREPTEKAWGHSVKTGEEYQIEHRVKHADGTFHWYLSRAVAARDDSGKVIKWYGTATNIDISKKAQIALEESEKNLKRLNEDLENIVIRRTEQVRTLSKALTLAEQRERKRFSYILHENLQQLLLGAKLLLGQHIREHKALPSVEEYDDVAEGLSILEKALHTTKTLSIELNPPVLRSQGLDVALRWLVDHEEKSYGLSIDLQMDPEIALIKNENQLMLTQMVRELLSNVIQHSGVKQASVVARYAERRITITISDQGKGFDTTKVMSETADETRLGLFSIRERLRLFGGELKVKSAQEKGTECEISLTV